MRSASELLENYAKLVVRVDELSASIVRDFEAEIQCRKGCDGCCRHFSVFWVEAVNLAMAVDALPPDEAAIVRAQALSGSEQDACPLLYEGCCLLYDYRPIICRTHGLPILTTHGGQPLIDFCPMNFVSTETIPGSAVINLDRLNETLAVVNTLFVQGFFKDSPPAVERISIADSLLLKV